MKFLTAGLMLSALLAAPALAGGQIAWGGVGWYVKTQGDYAGATPIAVSGPYSSKAECEAYIARVSSEYPNSKVSRWCNYETVAWASPDYDDYEE